MSKTLMWSSLWRIRKQKMKTMTLKYKNITVAIFTALLAALPCGRALAQDVDPADTLKKVFFLNDYTMIGVEYGASVSRMQFNPSKTQGNLFVPQTMGVYLTKYGKLFDGSPNFGLKTGVRYSHEGYMFKENKETGITPTLEGAEKAIIEFVEVPFMAHFHSDGLHFKVMVDLGIYAGYRLSIERIGDYVPEEIRNDFREWDDEIPYFSKDGYLIWRLMIDKAYQGKGYGREAIRLALDYIRTFPAGKAEYCWLSYEPENEVAKQLYGSFGFVEAPEFYKEGDEMPAVLKL